jgi:hypothetical protein
VTDIYQGLRNSLMAQLPANLGIAPQAPLVSVWGALVEIGLEGGSAMFVSLADGTTSMYTSTGGGVIGAGGHEGPAGASRQLLVEIQTRLDLFPPTEACPLPGREGVAFVVLTFDGIRRAESSTTRLSDPSEPLHGAWVAANNVITEIRLHSGSAERGRPASGVPSVPKSAEQRSGLAKLLRRSH